MATPAATLAILVEANTTAANANLAKTNAELEATKVAGGGATTATSKASSAMRKLGTAAKWGGAALAVGFVAAAKSSVTTTNDLTKSTLLLTKNFGLSGKAASEWAGVARARGADATKLGMAFKTLASQISSAADGSTTSVKMFKALGFSQQDIQKSMEDSQFAIGKVAQGFQDLPPGMEKANLAGKLFGRGWQTIFPILRDGRAAMQDQLDTVEKYGGVLQGKTLKQQEDFLAAQRESKIAWQGMQVTLGTALTPALIDANKQFQHMAAIMASKKLTDDEKFQKVADILTKDFSKALDVIVKMIPTIASRVGEQAPKIAKGLVEGFLHANVWGQLLIGTWFISKLGGASAIRAVGGKIAGMLGLSRATSGIAGGVSGAASMRGTTPANPIFVEDVSGGLGGGAGGAAKTGEGVAAGEIASVSTKGTLLKGGAILAGIGALSAAGAPGVKNTALNKLNAMAHGADPSRVLHLVGLPAVSDLLPAVQKSPSMDVVSIMKDALGIPDIRHPLDLPKHTELTSAGVGPPLNKRLFDAAIDSVGGLVDKSQVSGRKIADIVGAMRKDYGSLAKAADDMSKRQVHDFLSLAVQAKTPKPVLRDLVKTFAKTGKLSGDDIKDLAKVTGLSAKDIRDASDKTAAKWSKDQKKVRDATDQTKQHVSDAVAKQTANVINSYGNQSHAVKVGMDTIRDNTNSALKGLGLDKAVQFRTNEAPIGAGGVGHRVGQQKGGMMVGGIGSGDKVPAMLEPGEFVLNREAVKGIGAARLQAMNKAIPRFAKGGVIEQALGPYTIPPIMYDPNHAGSNSHVHADFFTVAQALAYGHKMQGMGWSIGEYTPSPGNPFNFGPITTTHQSPGHYDGTAFDANAADESKAAVAAVAKLFNSGVAGAAVAEKLKRILLEGPKGPLRDMGQAALDKTWRAANRFLARQAPKVSTTSADFPGGQFSKSELMKLWQRVNDGLGDPNLMAAIALAESGGNPNAVNASSGASGLWQILGQLVPGNIFDPVVNAKNAAAKLRTQGLGAWAVYTDGSYANFLQKGGMLPPYGGSFGRGGVVPGPMGAPRTIVAHGGESVGPPVVNVYLKGDAELLRDFIEVEVDGALNGEKRLGRQRARMRR